MNDAMIKAIHDAPGKFVIATAGGGSTATARLLALPGASRTVLETTVPYHPASLASYIGGRPDQACSAWTARAMAMASFQRARRFETDVETLFGVGCTAALTTDRERRGADRCFVAVQGISETREYELCLSRAARDRASQEAACSALILAVIAACSGLESVMPTLHDDESLETRSRQATPEWAALFRGEIEFTSHGIEAPKIVFPGAFNPFHDGHRGMAEFARRRLGSDVLLEIAAFNVDKPALDYIDMASRQQGLAGAWALTFTNAPTFEAKARLFPGATFLVGTDTLERIGQPRYYQGSEALRDLALASMAERDIRFLVFGRQIEGTFRGLSEIEIPDRLRDLSEGVGESEFRVDLSSSALR